jgi:hypothetical protein
MLHRVATASARVRSVQIGRSSLSAVTRAASSGTGGRAGRPRGPPLSLAEQKIRAEEEEMSAAFWKKLNTGPEPRLRGAPPLPSTDHAESWAPGHLVSSLPVENALQFRTRFYIDSVGQQPAYANKVQVAVSLPRLGLSESEMARLLAVARPNYNHKRRELLFTCRRYAEVARNKEELRLRVEQLLADAREHSCDIAPDEELPLAARARPWLPGDRRVYKGRPKRKLNKGSPG